jgi:hypothetical protein
MWWSFPLWRRVTRPVLSMRSVRTVVGVGGAVAWGGLRPGGVSVAGVARPGRERCGTLGVLDVGEGVQQGLELGEGGGLARLGAEPVLHGVLESFGFALGLGMVRLAVLLGDAERRSS